MYSTNLTIHQDVALFSGTECVGTSYGWRTEAIDSPANQTAKDNALLWSCAPEAIFLLSEVYHEFTQTGDRDLWLLRTAGLLDKLAHAIPPASVAADA